MKKTIIAVLAAGALVLTACGSDSDGAESDTTTADSTADSTADTSTTAATTTVVGAPRTSSPP